MKRFKHKATLLEAVAFLIENGKNCTYREANEHDGFVGWILYY